MKIVTINPKVVSLINKSNLSSEDKHNLLNELMNFDQTPYNNLTFQRALLDDNLYEVLHNGFCWINEKGKKGYSTNKFQDIFHKL